MAAVAGGGGSQLRTLVGVPTLEIFAIPPTGFWGEVLGGCINPSKVSSLEGFPAGVFAFIPQNFPQKLHEKCETRTNKQKIPEPVLFFLSPHKIQAVFPEKLPRTPSQTTHNPTAICGSHEPPSLWDCTSTRVKIYILMLSVGHSGPA